MSGSQYVLMQYEYDLWHSDSPPVMTRTQAKKRSLLMMFNHFWMRCTVESCVQKLWFTAASHTDGLQTVTIFAYGVTSSGKTFTMSGSPSQPGIIPRVMKELLHRKSPHQPQQVSFSMSYMEIYKDEVYDLLGDRENVSLSAGQSPSYQPLF